MQNLESLNFDKNNFCFDNFDFLGTLPKIKNINIGSNMVESPKLLLGKRKIPFGKNSRIQFKNNGLFEGDIRGNVFNMPLQEALRIGSALGKSSLTQTEKKYFFYAIATQADLKKLPQFALHEYAALLNVAHTNLRNLVNARIAELAEKEIEVKSLNENSVLWVVGTPSMKKLELNKKLKSLNINFTYKKTPEVTHIVIGKNPKEYKTLENIKAELITESQLYNLFTQEQPKYIQEAVQQGDETMSENVSALISSNDIDSVIVGMELLKSGGVPADLIGDLLVVQKTHPDNKVRKIAKTLLLENAPPEWMPLINDTQRFTNITTAKAQQTNKSLEKVAKNTSRKLAARLSLLLFKKHDRGLRYVLYHFHEPSEERTTALKAMVKDKCFDFSKGLGFKKWDNPESAILYKLKIPAKIKFDVVDHCPGIERMNLHNCKMTSLPKDIGKATELKYLDCSYNFLGSIPKAIGDLKNLEELNLQMNAFETFPLMLKYATSLKQPGLAV